MTNKIEIKFIVLYLILSLSLFLDFYFEIDFSNGGSKMDFNGTFPLVVDLSELRTNRWAHSVHFPLHYSILAILYKIFHFQEIIRIIYIIIGMSIPYLFFLNLKKVYFEININKLFFFSSLIFLLPFFRSSIVWANSATTGLFFYLLATIFLINYLEKKKTSQMISSILILSLAVYSVQYYAAFFLIYLFLIFRKFKFQTFLVFFLICIISSIPGFLFFKIFPNTSEIPFANNPFNIIILSSSIICFYFISILNLDNFKKIWINFFEMKFNFLFIFILILSLIIFTLNFDYNEFQIIGGGFFYKLSYLLFDNLYLLYFFSFLGFIFLIFFSNKNEKKFLDILIILIMFILISFNQVVFQKYFEPMFIITIFLFAKCSFISDILRSYKNISFTFLYYLIYLSSAFIYGKNLI